MWPSASAPLVSVTSRLKNNPWPLTYWGDTTLLKNTVTPHLCLLAVVPFACVCLWICFILFPPSRLETCCAMSPWQPRDCATQNNWWCHIIPLDWVNHTDSPPIRGLLYFDSPSDVNVVNSFSLNGGLHVIVEACLNLVLLLASSPRPLRSRAPAVRGNLLNECGPISHRCG